MFQLNPRLALLSIALALSGAGGVWPARAAETTAARSLDLTYDVYLGGLHIFTFDVDMALQPDRYRVTVQGETRGVVGLLYSWHTKAAAEGLDQGGRIEARRYATESDWQGSQRTVQLRFEDDGRYELQQTPPPEPDPEIEGGLPKALPDATVDPLTLAIATTRTFEATGRCDQTVPVFDGRRRYDLTLKQVDATVLPPNEYSIYQGAAVRCSLGMKRISGFRKSWQSRHQWDADAPAPPTVWVARIGEDTPPLPVRYEGAIALGTIVIHLSKAEVRRGVDETCANAFVSSSSC